MNGAAAYLAHLIKILDMPDDTRVQLLSACNDGSLNWIKQEKNDAHASGVSLGMRMAEMQKQQFLN